MSDKEMTTDKNMTDEHYSKWEKARKAERAAFSKARRLQWCPVAAAAWVRSSRRLVLLETKSYDEEMQDHVMLKP